MENVPQNPSKIKASELMADAQSRIETPSRRADYTAPNSINASPPLNDHDISDAADALNFLLTELDTPKQVRLLLQAFLGLLAGRKTIVTFYHFDLAKRLYHLPYIPDHEEFKRHKNSLESKVQSGLQKLLVWRDGWKNLPIEYTPGGRTIEGDKYPSKIQTPLLSWAVELLESVRAVEDFESLTDADRANTFRDSARRLLAKKKVTRAKPTPKPEPRKQSTTQIYGTLVSAASRYAAKKIGETQQSPCDVIDSILRDLDTRLRAQFEMQGVNFTPLSEQDFTPPENFQPLSSANMEVEFPESLSLTPPDLADDLPDELLAVEAYASVGGELDQVLLTNDTKPSDKQVVASTKADFSQFLAVLPALKKQAEIDHSSIIGRIRGPVLQIDDCDQATASVLQQFAFATFETSPKSFQCWLAFKDQDDKEAAAVRLFAGLKIVLPGTQANKGSGGAIRWPGTTNYKPNRQQPDSSYPVVKVVRVQLGRTVTPSELDEAGLLAVEAHPPQRGGETQSCFVGAMREYGYYLDRAPKREDGQPDRSKADMAFVNACIRAGWGDEAIATELMRQSERAKEKGWQDVRATIDHGRTWMGSFERT